MDYRKKAKRDAIAYFIAMLISIGFCVILYMNSQGDRLSEGGRVSFLLYPLVPVFAGIFLANVIKAYLAGDLAKTMANTFFKLGWGMTVFLFFNLMPEAHPVNLASWGIPFLFLVYTVKSEMLYYLRQYIIASAILKSILFLMQGIIASFMISALWKDGVWRIGFNVSVSFMVFFGFLILALSMLLSLLELSKQEQLIAVGKWFGKAAPSKFIFGCVLVFLLKDIPEIVSSFPRYFIYIEWFLLFVVLLILLFVLFNKIRNEVSIDPKENLRKHVQEITYNKELEVRELSKYLDDYILKGDMSKILILIADAGKRSAISTEKMGSIIKPMLNHKDLPFPLIYLSSEKLLNEKRDAEKRREIIEKVIAEIKNYGRMNNEN